VPRWDDHLTPFDGPAGARGPAEHPPVVALRVPRDEPLGKSLLDRVGAAVLLLLVLPVLAGVAALLWLRRPGPVLSRRRCAGACGRTFELLSFRPAAVGEPVTLDRLLRETGLDQLPQLLNVLRGDLSLIGPRPQPAAAARGAAELRPGLIWQPTTDSTRYAQSWSLGRDLAILATAVRTALGGRRL
jgi:hypothetical protein